MLKVFTCHLSFLSPTAKLEGRSCEYNGRMYQNGQSFRAGCKHQCICIDGAVGCSPLCPTDIPLATPSCPAPRLVKVPGQCCLSVDCHSKSSVLPPVFKRPQPPPYLFPDLHKFKKPGPKPHPYKPKNSLSNELTEVDRKWEKPRSRKHLPGEGAILCVGLAPSVRPALNQH